MQLYKSYLKLINYFRPYEMQPCMLGLRDWHSTQLGEKQEGGLRKMRQERSGNTGCISPEPTTSSPPPQLDKKGEDPLKIWVSQKMHESIGKGFSLIQTKH